MCPLWFIPTNHMGLDLVQSLCLYEWQDVLMNEVSPRKTLMMLHTPKSEPAQAGTALCNDWSVFVVLTDTKLWCQQCPAGGATAATNSLSLACLGGGILIIPVQPCVNNHIKNQITKLQTHTHTHAHIVRTPPWYSSELVRDQPNFPCLFCDSRNHTQTHPSSSTCEDPNRCN